VVLNIRPHCSVSRWNWWPQWEGKGVPGNKATTGSQCFLAKAQVTSRLMVSQPWSYICRAIGQSVTCVEAGCNTSTVSLWVVEGTKRNPVPGAITGPPCFWGIKIRGPAFQVGGVSNQTVKRGLAFCGSWTREWLPWQWPDAILQVN
jgi:hypothetical protein